MLDMVVKFAKEMQRKLKLATSNHAQVSNVLEVKYINLKLRIQILSVSETHVL